MNQILLTEKMASKCRKKIEKKQAKREARILRINNFKLIFKNVVKCLFSRERSLEKYISKEKRTKKTLIRKFQDKKDKVKIVKPKEQKANKIQTIEKVKHKKEKIKVVKAKEPKTNIIQFIEKLKHKKEKIKVVKAKEKKINIIQIIEKLKHKKEKIKAVKPKEQKINIIQIIEKLKHKKEKIKVVKAKEQKINIIQIIEKLKHKKEQVKIVKAKEPKTNIIQFIEKLKHKKEKIKVVKAKEQKINIVKSIEILEPKKQKAKNLQLKKVAANPMTNIVILGKKLLMSIKHRENMIYKAGLVFSIICSLTFGGLSAYATYDRNKNEEFSRELLASIKSENTLETEGEEVINKITSERISMQNDSVVVILNREIREPKINIAYLANIEKEENNTKKYIEVSLAENGETYYIVAEISIPKINLNYPVLSETSDTLLKISPCKYWGGDIHSVGNLCIMGHNYVNSQFFSKVPSLKSGDIIELTDVITEETVNYSVYDKYTISDDDMSCTSQMTDGNVELTLITCTNNGKGRVVIKARAI